MATPAATLAILVEANTAAANANLAKTDAALRGTAAAGTTATGASSRAGSAIRKLGTAAKWGGAALAVGFVVEAKKAVTTTQDLTKTTLSLHKNLGLSTKAASEWAGVLKARGADTTKAGMAFKTFATQVSAAGHGSASAIQTFRELGFSQEDIHKAMTNTQFALTKVSDGLNQLPAGADKATISSKLFGRGWQTVAPVLRDGSDAMQEQLDTVAKYGGVLQGKTLKQQEDFLAASRESKIAWQGMQVTLATALTPTLEKVNEQFQHIAAIMANPKLTDDERFTRVAHILEKDFRRAMNVITDVLPTIISKVGQQAPKIAGALVQGFLHADVWGKLLLGAWFIKKLGGWGLVTAIGSRFGTRMGSSMATSTVATSTAEMTAAQGKWAAVGRTIGLLIAPAIAAVVMAEVTKQADDWAAAHGIHLAQMGKAGGPVAASVGSTGSIADVAGKAFGGGAGTDVPTGKLNKHLAALNDKFGDLASAADQMSKRSRMALVTLAATGVKQGDVFVSELSDVIDQMGLTKQETTKALGHVKGDFKATAVVVGGASTKLERSVYDLSIKVGKRDIGSLIDHFGTLNNAAQHMSDVQRTSWINAAKQAEKNGFISKRELGKVVDAFRGTTQKTSDSADKMAQNVGNSYGNMVNAAGKGMNTLRDNTNKALKGLGMTAKQVSFSIHTAHLQGTPGFHQKGGQIVGGVGSGDKVPAMLEPGEFVLNREAVKGIGQARLEAMNKAIPRFAKGGSVGGLDFALGPYTVPPIQYAADHAGANSHVHISAFSVPWLIGVGHKIQQMGNSVGEFQPTSFGNPFHFGPVTTSAHAHYPTDHYSGHAVDVNSLRGAENKSWVAAIANVLSGGAGAAVVEKIKRVLLQGPKGPLTDMGQAALDKVWHGANAFLAKQSPKMFTTGADVPVGPGAISRQEMRKLLKAHGMPNWTGWIALAESGLNPHATSSADARGLFQILESVWGGGDRLYDPNYNVAKARQVLTQQGISAWAPSEHGGFLPEGWGPHVGQPFRKGGMVMPPFGGSFGNGGTVPGPIGAPRTIVAHGGESVGPPEVHLHFKPGTEWLRDFVQVEVEDGLNGQTRLHRQKARMRR